MELRDWFLTVAERGNRWTTIDSAHGDGTAWTTGNAVRPLVHGAAYFAELLAAIRRTRDGDHLFFTDWRGDPDERLDGPGTEVSRVLAEAAARGVVVRGLVWRSHLDRFRYHEAENRHLGEEIQAAGGECLLDMRVRPGGSHHQKLVVLRYRDRPEGDVAFLGGIDLCHGRRDDEHHEGDPQPCPIGVAYGPRPAWHDVQVAIRGPAVADLEAAFRERPVLRPRWVLALVIAGAPLLLSSWPGIIDPWYHHSAYLVPITIAGALHGWRRLFAGGSLVVRSRRPAAALLAAGLVIALAGREPGFRVGTEHRSRCPPFCAGRRRSPSWTPLPPSTRAKPYPLRTACSPTSVTAPTPTSGRARSAARRDGPPAITPTFPPCRSGRRRGAGAQPGMWKSYAAWALLTSGSTTT